MAKLFYNCIKLTKVECPNLSNSKKDFPRLILASWSCSHFSFWDSIIYGFCSNFATQMLTLMKDLKVFWAKSDGAGGEKSMTKSATILGVHLQFLTVVCLSQVPTQQDAIPTEVCIRPCEKHSCNKCSIEAGTLIKCNIQSEICSFPIASITKLFMTRS